MGIETITIAARLRSTSPYSQSRAIQSHKNTGESPDAFEERTWRERMHVSPSGKVFIPPMAIKNAMPEAAKFIGESIPGKGKATWTKHFEAGLMVIDPIDLGIDAKAVPGERLFVPASGKRGDGKRVFRTFPLIASWEGDARIIVLDPEIVSNIKSTLGRNGGTLRDTALIRHLEHAGRFIGIGRFRPRNNGFYGRFDVVSVQMES